MSIFNLFYTKPTTNTQLQDSQNSHSQTPHSQTQQNTQPTQPTQTDITCMLCNQRINTQNYKHTCVFRQM